MIDLAGVFGNAVLGGIVAREQRMDPIGFVALAILSGLGGGLIRDTLLQHGPPVALTDYLYVITALAGAVVAFLAPVHDRVWGATFPVVDALALGCWAAAGAQKTLDVGLGWLPAVLVPMKTPTRRAPQRAAAARTASRKPSCCRASSARRLLRQSNLRNSYGSRCASTPRTSPMCVSRVTVSKAQCSRPLRCCSSDASVAAAPVPMQLVAVKCSSRWGVIACLTGIFTPMPRAR